MESGKEKNVGAEWKGKEHWRRVERRGGLEGKRMEGRLEGEWKGEEGERR